MKAAARQRPAWLLRGICAPPAARVAIRPVSQAGGWMRSSATDSAQWSSGKAKLDSEMTTVRHKWELELIGGRMHAQCSTYVVQCIFACWLNAWHARQCF
eukprot:353158-Chlamydomonas_euryale.AAC.2